MEQATYSWKDGVPKFFETPKYKPIQLVNTKSVYKPFGIYYVGYVPGLDSNTKKGIQ